MKVHNNLNLTPFVQTYKSYSDREFMSATPRLQNDLPRNIWDYKFLEEFEKNLRTHLYLIYVGL